MASDSAPIIIRIQNGKSQVGEICFPCQEKRQKELQEKLSDIPHYTPEDMCFLLGYLNPESVKRLARKGKIPGRIPTIGRHLYLKEQVDRWIQNRGRPPDEKRDRHFQELSVTALKLVSNLEKYLDNGTEPEPAIGNVVYSGWLNLVDGVADALSVEMNEIDKPMALNLLFHLKDEFPELSGLKDWASLKSNEINYDLIAKLKLKANRGDFSGRCQACPDSSSKD